MFMVVAAAGALWIPGKDATPPVGQSLAIPENPEQGAQSPRDEPVRMAPVVEGEISKMSTTPSEQREVEELAFDLEPIQHEPVATSDIETDDDVSNDPEQAIALQAVPDVIEPPEATNPDGLAETEESTPIGQDRVASDPPEPPANTLAEKVSRAQFTTGIQRREPIDRVEDVVYADGNGPERLYYFTELQDMKGETVTHRWEHEGKVVAEVRFKVAGDRWRVNSSKYLPPSMTGRWQVVVTDSRGQSMTTDRFVYRGPGS